MEQNKANERAPEETHETGLSFFEQQDVQVSRIPVGKGVPFGITQVANPALGIGGAYGTWGDSYDNVNLPDFLSQRMGVPLSEAERLDLAPLGFHHRHHIAELSEKEHYEVELEVGARFLRAA